ncbi:MAG: hypothetical protein ACI9IP_000338 [Arcticibacterium sp.]|jgi:hypothetical protein
MKNYETGIPIIISAVIWAAVIIACSKILGDAYDEIQGVLLTGATAHVLLFSSIFKIRSSKDK